MGVVELTNAGYEARRSIWGQISDAKIADLARRIAVGALSRGLLHPCCCVKLCSSLKLRGV